MTSTYRLEPLWRAILDLYLEFDAVCKRYGLTYYAAYGTVLGAIRHHGFIPWDDDFDVCMTRKDYNRLCVVFNEAFPDYIQLIKHDNTQGYDQLFGKIQECREDVVSQVERDCGGRRLPQGIYIDLFVLDNYPDGIFAACKFKLFACAMQACQRYLMRRFVEHKKILGYALWLLGWCVSRFYGISSRERQLLVVNDYLVKMSQHTSRRLCRYCSIDYRIHQVFERQVFGRACPMEFEGTTILVPADWDSYLKEAYGDYMRLPPEDQRNSHHTDVPDSPWRFTETGKRPE